MTLDAHGQSILRCAAQAVELGVSKALRGGSALIRIRHCHNRILLLGYLARCADQGLNFCAYWRDARQELVATFSAGDSQPSLRVHDLPQPAMDDEQSINVLISRHFTLLPCPGLTTRHYHTFVDGLEVDDEVWARLKNSVNECWWKAPKNPDDVVPVKAATPDQLSINASGIFA
ncbi:hypothetical protein [Pseudomonas sp. TH10]|uniref:hypothetical protein n=1 Tax=Pseudomonas sp. TH10 TaxID=2796376 RepID=UPI001F5B712F|nr:hypothetical protein [Pseudomonas sp. TH10]